MDRSHEDRLVGPVGSSQAKLLFVSNGYGEDSIAADIIRRLPANLRVDAYPTLGDGRAYCGICDVVGPRAEIASKGSRAYRGALLDDIRSGVLATIPPSLRFLRAAPARYDRVVVVGDQLMVLACLLASVRNIVYLDVYRSGYDRGYWRIEKSLMRTVCAKVFCREENLAASLCAVGVEARAVGNIMMDTIARADYDARSRRTRPHAVTLLPGSRDTTLDNFRLQMSLVRGLPPAHMPDLFAALAPGVDPVALAAESGMQFVPPASDKAADAGSLGDGSLVVHLTRGALGNLLDVTDVALSQAGTATIQTVGSGIPVITFRSRRNRPARNRAVGALYGDARLLVEPDSLAAGEALELLLSDDADRLRRGAIGRERIGPPGAIEAIIGELTR